MKFLAILFLLILASCANEKRAGSVDIPVDKSPMQLVYNKDFSNIPRSLEYSFEDDIYKKEATNLVIYYVFSDKLKKDIKILAYDNPSISNLDVFTIPISEESQIRCSTNQKIEVFKRSIQDFTQAYSKEKNIFLNKDEQFKDGFYQEYILSIANRRVHYFEMHLYRFLEVNHPEVHSLACMSVGRGNRNTFISLTDELRRQIEK